MTDAHTKIENAEHRLREGLDTVRDTAAKVYYDAGDKAAEALDASKETARRTVNSLESNPLGILVGGLVVGIAEQLVGGYINPGLKDAIGLIFLFVILIARPQGLFGKKVAERV